MDPQRRPARSPFFNSECAVVVAHSPPTFDVINMHWRKHLDLQGKFHPSHPDDLQVVIHDGGPRLTQLRPEVVWVTITSFDGKLFTGTVLNAPTQLKTVQQNQAIRFLVEAGTGHVVMVTEKYLNERVRWKIGACSKCHFAELFDAPSDLARATFPNIPADTELEAFTAFCPLCGGVQTVESVAVSVQPANRHWWKFWQGK